MIMALVMSVSMLPMMVLATDGGTSIILPIGDIIENDSQQNYNAIESFEFNVTPVYISTGEVSVLLPTINKPEGISAVENARIQAIDTNNEIVAQTSIFSIYNYETTVGNNSLYLLDVLAEGTYSLRIVYGDVQNPTALALDYALVVVNAPVIIDGYLRSLTAGLNPFKVDLTITGFDGDASNFSFSLIDTDNGNTEIVCTTDHISTNSSGVYGRTSVGYSVTPSSEIIDGHQYDLKITAASGELYSTATGISTTAYEAIPSKIAVLEVLANEVVPGQLEVKVGGVEKDTDYTITVALGDYNHSTNYIYNNTLKPTVINDVGVFNVVVTKNGLTLPLSAYGNTYMWITVSDGQGDSDYRNYNVQNSFQRTSLSLSKISDTQYHFSLFGDNVLLDLYEQDNLSFTLRKNVDGTGHIQVGITAGSVSKQTESDYWGTSYTFSGTITTSESLSSGTLYYIYHGEESIDLTSTIDDDITSTKLDIHSLTMNNFDHESSTYYFNFGQFPITAILSGSSEKVVAQLYDLTSKAVVAQTEEISGVLNGSDNREYHFVIPASTGTLDMEHSYVIRFVSDGEIVSSADYSSRYSSMIFDTTQILPQYVDVQGPVFAGDNTLKLMVSSGSFKNVPVDYYMTNKIDVISEASDLSLTYTSAEAKYQNYYWIVTLTLDKPIKFGSYKYAYSRNNDYYDTFATIPTGSMVLGTVTTDLETMSISIVNSYNLQNTTYTAELFDIYENGYGKLADITLSKQGDVLSVTEGFPNNLPSGSYILAVFAGGTFIGSDNVYIDQTHRSAGVVIRGYHISNNDFEEIIYNTDSSIIYLHTSHPNYAYVRFSESSSFSGATYRPIRQHYNQSLMLSEENGLKTIYVQFRSTAGEESGVYIWKVDKVSEIVEPTIVDVKLTVDGLEVYRIPEHSEFKISLVTNSQLTDAYVQFWNDIDEAYDYTKYPMHYKAPTEEGYLFEGIFDSNDIPFAWSNTFDNLYNFTAVNVVLTNLLGTEDYEAMEIPLSFRALTHISLSGWYSYGGTVYTSSNDFTLSGHASPNSTVTATINSNNYQATTDVSGAFAIMITDLNEETHKITVMDDKGLSTNKNFIYNLVVDKTSPVIDTLKATSDAGNITISWTSSDNDIAYYMLWKDNAMLVRASDAYTSTSYITTGGIGATFKVIAVDRAGNQSVAKEITVGDEEPPTTPGTPTMISHGTKHISFDWTASTDNVAVYQYAIYRDNVLVETVDYSILSYTDIELSEDSDYSYKVYALDRAGNQSEAATATLSTALLSITNSTSFSSEYIKEERPNGVDVSVTLNNSDSYYSLADVSIKLQYKLSTDEVWSEIALTGASAYRSGTWIIENLPLGIYTIRFHAVDKENTEKTTEEATVAISQDVEPPVITISKPFVNSTVGSKDFEIRGNATDNVEVDKVVLSYSLDGGTSFKGITTLTNEKVSGRTSYSWHYFFDVSEFQTGEMIIKAVAFDGRGNNSITFTTFNLDNTPPEVPSDFYVGGDKDKITVMWSYPDLNVGNDFSHFRVYRSTTVDGEFSLIEDNLKTIGFFDTVSTGITTDTKYYYYVTAVDDYNNESAGTIVLSGQLIDDHESPIIRSIVPAEGSNLQKTVEIKVSATDNYMLDKFVIEYKESTSDTWIHLTTVTNETITRSHIYNYSWDISSLSTGSYDIRVFVYDVSGNEAAILTRTYNVISYASPSPPVLYASPNGHKLISLNWSYSGDDTSLSSFKLYRSENGVDYTYISGFTALTTSYLDKVAFSGNNQTYYYRLEAVDKYGAFAESTVVDVIAISADNEKPVAMINPEKLVYAAIGKSFSMTAASSTDNDAIASYSWDFGDGNTATGMDVAHVYTSVGDYTVTLTVTDMYGNSDSTSTSIMAVDLSEENVKYTELVLLISDAVDLTAIGSAEVIVNSENFSEVMKTGADGSLTVIVPNGTYTIGVYANGYIVRTITLTAQGGTEEHHIGLSNGSVIGGSISATEMSYDEIVAAGIDVNAEGNQHIYKFAVELTFFAGIKTYSLPYTVYKNEHNEIIRSDGGGFISFEGSGGLNIGVFPITENFVLVIYGEARWLKEMYNVELVVINNSNTDTLDQVTATLELPEGLSLADMNSGVQEATQHIGSVGYSDTAAIRWYVRGDKAGEYNLTARVDAVSMPYGDVISQTFTTTSPLKVYAGTALKLEIIADDIAERGKDYNVTFRLENTSDKSLYNLSFGITGSEQYRVIGIGDKEGEMPIDGADYGEAFIYEVSELAPGGYFELKLSTTIWFGSVLELIEFTKLGAFVDIAYYLKDVSVVALEGSTTVIPHEFIIRETEKKSLVDKIIFDLANELWGDDLLSVNLGSTIIEILGEVLGIESTIIKGAKTLLKLQQGETDHKLTVSIDDGSGNADSIYNDFVIITTGSDSHGIVDLWNGTKLTVESGELSIQAKGPGSTKIKIGVEDSLGNLEREYILDITIMDIELKNKLILTQDEITGEFRINGDTIKTELKLKREEEKALFLAHPFMWFESQLVFDVNDTTENSKFELNISSDDFSEILLETVTTMLTIDGKVATLDFNRESLQSVAEQVEAFDETEIKFIARQLSEAEAIMWDSDRPMYEFLILANGETIGDFGNGIVYVSLPYKPQDGELIENIFVERVNEDGSVDIIQSTYEDGSVKFETKEFSYYRIAYADKITPVGAPTVNGTLSYGQKLSDLALSVTMTDEFGNESIAGTITWESPDNIPVVGAPTQAWIFTPNNETLYSRAYGLLTITVNKSTPLGTPTYDKITTAGRTLADANLDGNFTNRYSGDVVLGTLAWDDGESASVIANRSYSWTFTPFDTENYEVAAGSMTLYSTGGSTIAPGNNATDPGDGTADPEESTSDTATHIGDSKVITPVSQNPTENADGSVTLPGGGVIEVGVGEMVVVIDAPIGTIVNKDGSVVIPDNMETLINLSKSGVASSMPGGTTIRADGTIIVGKGIATVKLPNGTEMVLPEGSTISGNKVTVGTGGAILNSDNGSETIAENVVLVLDDNMPVGFYILNPFYDIKSSSWYYDAVMFAYQHGIMNGTSNITFQADQNLNRAMMVQILFNYDGRISTGYAHFDDVALEAWYTDAIAWAAENEIVNGVGQNLFAPTREITREQMAVMLYRYCEYRGITLPAVRTSGSFSDRDTISDWAIVAVDSMYRAGILNGKGNNVFDSQGKATRAEVAQMMMNFLELLK